MRLGRTVFTVTAAMAAGGATAAIAGVILARGIMRALREVSLAGKVAVVTGGTRGLGLAIAQELALEGTRLAICARDQDELTWAEKELRAMGAEVLAVPCDVGSREEVHFFMQRVKEHYGPVDVLVNNAGTIEVGPIHAQTVEDFEEAMRVMFWGTVFPTLEALPDMVRRGDGRIANITSIGGKVSVPRLLPYGAAKFAAVGFSEGLHAEVAKDGVKVVTVVPGLMRTGSYVNAQFKGEHRKEFAWFSLGATTPVTAMSARRAARKIVHAIKAGSSEVVLSWQAKTLALAHGIAPGMVSDALGMVNRVLPGADSDAKERFSGKESRSAVSESVVTELGRRAGERLHQYPEHRAIR